VTYNNKILYVDLVNDKDSVISELLLHADILRWLKVC